MTENNKTDVEKSVKKYERLQELATKAREEMEKLVKLVTKEADLGSKFVKDKIDVLNFNVQIDRKYRDIGKEVYNLVHKGEIDNQNLKDVIVEIDGLYDRIETLKNNLKDTTTKMKDEVKRD